MIGQLKLLKALDSYTAATFPRTAMFIGESGCGKHTIVKMLADRFNFEIVEINSSVEPADIIEYQQYPLKRIYLIDLDKFTDKQQNQFLKFIEEPSQNAYVMLITNSTINILPTVLNRCVKFTFDSYSVEELKQIYNYDSDLVYEVCTTPGQLKNLDYGNMIELQSFCKNIIKSISKASYGNTLTLATKINYKEEYNKFDFNLFFKMLKHEAFADYKASSSDLSLKIYLLTVAAEQDMLNKSVAKEIFMLNFLTKLWKEAR